MDRAGKITFALSIIAIIISLYSAYNSYQQTRLTEELNHLNVDPEVLSFFSYPEFNNSKDNPLVVVKNNGPISIVSLGVKHKLLAFDKAKNNISIGLKSIDSINDLCGEYMIFERTLNPKDYVSLPLAKLISEHDSYNRTFLILAYVFDIDYYRESDMKHYSKRDIYFIDNGKTYKHKDFVSNSYYEPVMRGIDSYQFPNNQNLPISQLVAMKNKTRSN